MHGKGCIAVWLLVMLTACSTVPQQAPVPAIEQALTHEPGSVQRGRGLVANRQQGMCLLCHSAPIEQEQFQGNLAPPLHGVGARLNAAQLRQRMVDSRAINPHSIMPPYFSAQGLNQVAAAHQGRSIFNAQQIEDVVAYLQTLK